MSNTSLETLFRPLPISLCVLCLNEEDNLPRALAQASQFAEVLVLDTGSSDCSIKLAKELGATVAQSEWLGFAKTRRKHFEMAREPWILWLDADEEVTPQLVAELRRLFEKENIDDHAAYEVNREMVFLGKRIRHGDWFPDRVVRLFKADRWSMPEREVHESLKISGSVGRLQSLVPHYSYCSWRDREERVESYSSLWAKQQFATGRRSGSLAAWLRAGWKLIRGLFLKKGFLDGWLGVRIAWSNAAEVYRKYQKLHQLGR